MIPLLIFLLIYKMANEYKTIECRLDGKQSVSIPIDIKQNGRYVDEPLDVVVRGFLKFSDSGEEEQQSNTLEDKTVVYPVLFTSDTVRVTNGRCVVTILPRSEDIFEEEVVDDEDDTAISDSTLIENGGVREDEQITDPDKEPVTIVIRPNVRREPY